MGDSSDNIPGVVGIGPIKAQSCYWQFFFVGWDLQHYPGGPNSRSPVRKKLEAGKRNGPILS